MSDLQKKIDELSKKLVEYTNAYYEGNPIVSDAEFDRLEKELGMLDPNHPVLKLVGVESKGKVFHDPFMLSAIKISDISKAKQWASTNKVVWGFKVDGLSIKLVYVDGILVLGATRGNGKRGDDITAQVFNLKGVPREI